MTEIFTARSVEEAKEMAAEKFGKKINEIKFEILDEGKKGLFGIGSKEAKVKATVTDGTHVQEKAPKAASEVPKTTTSPERKVEPATKTVAADKPVITTETETVEIPAEPVKDEKTENKTTEEAENVSEALDEEAYSLDNFTLIEDEALINPKVKLAMDYITSILRAMDVDVEFKVYQNETGAVINLESDNNGTIIGRRGETLDSIQYLCSIIANKGDKDYYRITIDCLGYRNKRKDTLEQLAAKVAKSVLRTGRSQPLEPMNPYERRVIHSTLQDDKYVDTHSEGDEPYRKVVVTLKKGYDASDNRGGYRNNYRGGRGRYNKYNKRQSYNNEATDEATGAEE